MPVLCWLSLHLYCMNLGHQAMLRWVHCQCTVTAAFLRMVCLVHHLLGVELVLVSRYNLISQLTWDISKERDMLHCKVPEVKDWCMWICLQGSIQVWEPSRIVFGCWVLDVLICQSLAGCELDSDSAWRSNEAWALWGTKTSAAFNWGAQQHGSGPRDACSLHGSQGQIVFLSCRTNWFTTCWRQDSVW